MFDIVYKTISIGFILNDGKYEKNRHCVIHNISNISVYA